MPSLATGLLALALRDPRPMTATGVWLTDPPAAGTRVVAPLDVTGETQAPEGVLKVELFVVRGPVLTSVASYEPALPLGTVPFEFRWDPTGLAPGRVTIRVVATTLVRGFRAEARDLVVPATLSAPARHPGVRAVPARRAAAAVPAAPAAPRPAVLRAPVLDTTGRAFGAVARTLPYRPAPPATVPVPRRSVPFEPAAADRSGWLSLAGGLLVLLVCSHLHRALRPQPDPRGRR
jgi:hypothetical protein